MTSSYTVGTDGYLASGIDGTLSLPGEAGPTKRAAALSNKINNVLSSSYADSETRNALRLLDARGAQNAEETRLNLKLDAQQEVIAINAQIVDDFGKVADQIKRVGVLIANLNQTCDDMRTHILLARQETAPMLEEASTLLARKDETEAKQHLLHAFTTHFLISDEDLTTLTSSAEPVNDQYFTVLARVKQIHKDCEILLGYENQRLGLEVMEQTTRNLDAGYQKLYNWIQREFKGLDLEDPHISGSIRRSLRALSERPTLFQNCLDFFGEARQATLSEAFGRALTDSSLGTSKAIDFSTHDPLRYIGDMLAWVHSTTVSEKEALEGLFVSDADEISRHLKSAKSSEPWARLRRTSSARVGIAAYASAKYDDEDEDDDEDDEEDTIFDGHAALNSLISRSMAAVSQILNQRISLTVRNLTDQITIYKSYNLLLFYHDIFVKLLGVSMSEVQQDQASPPGKPGQQQASKSDIHAQNSILVALSTLQSQARSHFDLIIKEDIEAHSSSSSFDPLPATLQPPGILQSNLVLFSAILHLRAPNLTHTEFAWLYNTLITPLIELCSVAASTLSAPSQRSPRQEKQVYIPTPAETRTESAVASASSSENNLNGREDGGEMEEDLGDEDTETFESTIYRLNYLYPILLTLRTLSKDKTLSPFTSAPTKSAETEGSTLSDELVAIVTHRFLLSSGVAGLLGIVVGVFDIDISRTPIMETTQPDLQSKSGIGKDKRSQLIGPNGQLEDAAATLDRFLASALMDVQDDLGKMSDKAVAKVVVAQAVGRFCDAFERLVTELDGLDDEFLASQRRSSIEGEGAEDAEDVKNGNEEQLLLREVYPRTLAEVRALLT